MKNKKLIRSKFRESVFKRDNHTCKVCGKKRDESELDAHHITDRNEMPKGGYVVSNGITVCKDECHLIVETFHISGGTEWVEGFHPNDLYESIGSSKEKAIEDSYNI